MPDPDQQLVIKLSKDLLKELKKKIKYTCSDADVFKKLNLDYLLRLLSQTHFFNH